MDKRLPLTSTSCPCTVTPHTLTGTLKDLDMRRNIRLHDPADCDHIKQQLKLDTDFLQSLGLMDYSLVLAVHIPEVGAEEGLIRVGLDGIRVGV